MPGITAVSLLFMVVLVISPDARSQDKPPAPVVAVFEIENRGSPLTYDELIALTDYLGTKLGERGHFQIIPRQEIRKRLVQQKKVSFRECYDQSCQIEVGRELAAQLTVSVSISKVGSTCIITSALYDLRKAATTNTASAKAKCNPDELLEAMDKIVAKLEGERGVGVKPKTPRSEPPIRHVEKTPPLPPPTAPVVKPRTKSTIVACLLSLFPGGGMYYLEKWVWGTIYLTGFISGIIAGPLLLLDDQTALGSVVAAVGGLLYPISIIHTYSAAENWRDPDVERISPGRGFSPGPIGEHGRDPHPAVYIPIFSGRF